MLKLNKDSRYNWDRVWDIIVGHVNSGIYLDFARMNSTYQEMHDKMLTTEEGFVSMLESLGYDPVDIGSPLQIASIFNNEGLQAHGKKGAKGYTYPKDSLYKIIENVGGIHGELARAVTNFRSFQHTSSKIVEVNGFCKDAPELGDEYAVVHPQISKAVSNRIFYEQPALSNLGELRWMVTAGPGKSIINFDYKQQEPWLMSNMLGLKPLLRRLEQHHDFYEALTQEVLGIDLSPEVRKEVKTAFLQTFYGAKLHSVIYTAPPQYRKMIEKIHSEYNSWDEVKALKERLMEAYETDGLVSSYFGTISHVPFNDDAEAWLREAYNRVFQSTGSDFLFFALESLQNYYEETGKDLRTYLMLHDEIGILAGDHETTPETINELTDRVLFEVEGWTPLRVEVSVMKDWSK